jgi:hypothetical protein
MAPLVVMNEDKTKAYLVHIQDPGQQAIVGEIDYLKFESGEWTCGTKGYAPYVLGPFNLIMLGEVPQLNGSFVAYRRK